MGIKWKKAPEELVTLLADRMKRVNCEYRKMFGYPACFINGNMFAGVHGDNLFLRMSNSDLDKIRKEQPEATLFEPMPRKMMSGYVVLPKSVYMKSLSFFVHLRRG